MARLRMIAFRVWFALFATSGVSAAEPTAPELEGPELIVNGSFEAPGEGTACPFAGWAGRSGQGGQYTFELAPGRTGKCAKIDGAKAGRGDIHTAKGFAVKAGETIRVRFWARTENFKGGAFAQLEGEPNDDGWHKINIDSAKEWKLYESRVTVPKGAKGQSEPSILIWFYHFGTGALFLDDISVRVVKPDPAGLARLELQRVRTWAEQAQKLAANDKSREAVKNLLDTIDTALKNPAPDAVAALRVNALARLSEVRGSDGNFALGVASSLEKVFLDEPFTGEFPAALNISLARNESEGSQAVILPAGKDLSGVTVELEQPPEPSVILTVSRVGYIDTSNGQRPYQSTKLGWWPDPLLPLTPQSAFDVRGNEAQPLLITASAGVKSKPGVYPGKLLVKVGGQLKGALPIEVEVYSFALPEHGHLATMALGSGPEAIEKFYGGDPDQKIAERFVVEACKHRLPPIGFLNGWSWKTPKAPKLGDGKYDFSKLDRWLDIFGANGVTRFPLAIAPRFRKFGGGDYTDEFRKDFGAFVGAYYEHLKSRNMAQYAVVYNIDEASDDPKLREWDECKAIYKVVKQAAPVLPVVQCLNEFKGVQALTGHADIWDLYFGQFEQAGGPERLKAGDQAMLAVCIWPHEHPNLFTEYPLLDARIMPWIAYRAGAKGFEYWDLFQTWDFNGSNKDWWQTGNARTTWKLNDKPHGDGLLMYPGPGGQPLSSLRLEALRDGIEDYEYLVLLSERAKSDPAAAALLKEALEREVSGVTSFEPDPRKLLDLRSRIGKLLSKAGP